MIWYNPLLCINLHPSKPQNYHVLISYVSMLIFEIKVSRIELFLCVKLNDLTQKEALLSQYLEFFEKIQTC